MKLDIKGQRIIRNEFRNEMAPNMKLNLQVNVNNQIKLPRQFGPGAVGTVVSKVMVGSPMHPLYLFMEQITNFSNTDKEDTGVFDSEEMMSLFKTICVPMAMKEVENNIKQLCTVYHIPEIKMQKNKPQQASSTGYLN